MPTLLPRAAAHLLSGLLVSLAASCGGDAPVKQQPSSSNPGPDPLEFSVPPRSCAFDCPVTPACAESKTPYACQNLGDWASLPHAETCPAWDGKLPEVKPGRCTVSAPTGEAIKHAGPDPDDPLTTIMPDGHRLRPAGAAWAFNNPDLFAGMTSNVIAVPGSTLVLTVDTGYGDHAVRLIDAAKIGKGDPVLQVAKFSNPAVLNWGMAFAPPDRVYVATDDGVVQVLRVDVAARTLTRDDARSITLPDSMDGSGNKRAWYASGVAISPDGKRLAVSPVAEKELLVFNIDPADAGYGALLARAPLGEHETFGVFFDPNDATGARAYVSMWSARSVLEVDLSDLAHASVARTFATGKDPEGIAFLDARWMVVANDLGDSLSLVDRASGSVTPLPIDAPDAGAPLHGIEPSTMAYDAQRKRLYVALSGVSALGAYDVDTSKSPPSVVPAGRLPTLWWPSGVALQDDGAVVLSSLRGDGTGPADTPYTFADDNVYSRLNGGVQRIPAPNADDLARGEAAVKASLAVGARSGYPTVTCPAGAHDFPVPQANTEGPSPVIQHVFLVVRENKAFDAVLGDFPGANGKPELMLKKTSAEMARIWANLRALGKQFALSDNFYTSAEISSLGHVWTTYGRSNDYNERTWALAGYGRSSRPSDVANGGVVDVGRPEEGSLFDWLGKNNVAYDILGEGVGMPDMKGPGRSSIDFKYPGGFIQNPGHPDLEKACYVTGRARVRCDLGSVVYMTLPNDHTQGVSPTAPIPETMCAVNDEATGMLIDGISHSPLWPTSLILITEDDPAQGSDHVDAHRTVLVAVSPWVKRGTVSHTFSDVSSLHKIIAHVLGLPYPNLEVKNAGLPLDLFTSTPDFTPYTYLPRAQPLACGEAASKFEAALSRSWDLTDVDRNPGLDAQVMRWMRGEQLTAPPTPKQRPEDTGSAITARRDGATAH